jgi:mannose-1-phosphate guanylyltransferase
MKAILLSAGLGLRLRPITDQIPKCLVPIKGVPLLQIWLESLNKANIGPFLVNTHYLSEQVEDFIEQGGFNSQVTLVHEPQLLGTAGTLIKNIDFFQDDDGMLIHADNYCFANFHEFVNAHKNRPENCVMTMMTFRSNTPSTCGIVELDEKGVVIGFHEKSEFPPGNLANGAIYILSRDLMKNIKNDFSNLIDFSTEVLPTLLEKIYTYETKELFIDIGTVESYEKANQLAEIQISNKNV